MAVTGNTSPASLSTPAERIFEEYGGFSRGTEIKEFGWAWFNGFRKRAVPTWRLGGLETPPIGRRYLQDRKSAPWTKHSGLVRRPALVKIHCCFRISFAPDLRLCISLRLWRGTIIASTTQICGSRYSIIAKGTWHTISQSFSSIATDGHSSGFSSSFHSSDTSVFAPVVVMRRNTPCDYRFSNCSVILLVRSVCGDREGCERYGGRVVGARRCIALGNTAVVLCTPGYDHITGISYRLRCWSTSQRCPF